MTIMEKYLDLDVKFNSVESSHVLVMILVYSLKQRCKMQL